MACCPLTLYRSLKTHLTREEAKIEFSIRYYLNLDYFSSALLW